MRIVKTICSAALPIILLAQGATAQGARKPAIGGVALAEAGRCHEAVPQLKKELPLIRNAGLKRSAGLAGVRCAMETGRLDDAVDFIRALTRDFPQDAEVLYQAVHVYSALSLKSSQDLLINASGSYQVRLLNAEALETQERWSEAAAEYRAVLAQNPNLQGIHYRLGRLLLSLPENALTPATRDEARREFEEELKINPRNAGAEYVLGEMARQAGDWAQAAKHFANAARLNPAFADASIGWGRSLISAGKYEEAIKPLERAVKLQPENPAAHYHLATAYRRAGLKEKAERESAAFKQASERAQRIRHDVRTGIVGPQKAEP
ncbi:MAG TPA: tetratricopeptide repeat protein [Blastocatellia bacterium]